MARRDQDVDETAGYDPEEALRRRILAQQQPDQAPESAAPIPAAPFDDAPTPQPNAPIAAASFASAAPAALSNPNDDIPGGGVPGGPYPEPVPPTPVPVPPDVPATVPTSPVTAGATNSAALPGWDQTKWDSGHNSIKYQFGRIASGVPQGDRAAMSAALPGIASQLGGTVVGDDSIDFHDGYGPIDVLTSWGTWAWTPPDQAGGGTAGAGASSGGGSAADAARTLGGAPSSGTSDYLAQLRSMIMSRLQGLSGPIDENATGIAGAMEAARNEGTRAQELERAQLAERLYAQGGLNTEAVGRGIQQSNERNATSLGGLHSQLIMHIVDQRQSELKDLLQMALASGDSESARALQWEIAQLNALLSRERLNLDAGIADQNFQLRGAGL